MLEQCMSGRLSCGPPLNKPYARARFVSITKNIIEFVPSNHHTYRTSRLTRSRPSGVCRLVLLLVNDPNKENSPEQTRHNIIEALLDNRGESGATDPAAYESSSPAPSSSSSVSAFTSPSSSIPFGQRLQDDGTPVLTASDGHHKKPRKGTRRRVVHKSRSTATTAAVVSSTAETPDARQGAAAAGETGAGLSSDSDARAVELLKSLYSIASKWS